MAGTQTWKDNLIAIGFNLVAAAYFYNVLQKDWKSIPDKENFADVRRLYRYIWLIYSLTMVVFGAQQILRYTFYVPSGMLGEMGRETFVNGLALLVVGTPIWVFIWKICQDALSDPAEQGSLIRMGVLYLLALVGVITVTTSAGLVLNTILLWIFGKPMTGVEFIRQVGGPISILIPWSVVWAYYGHWLNVDIQAVPDTQRRSGLRRFYYYILSLIGLAAAFTGVAMLLSVVIDQVGGWALWGEGLRNRTCRRDLHPGGRPAFVVDDLAADAGGSACGGRGRRPCPALAGPKDLPLSRHLRIRDRPHVVRDCAGLPVALSPSGEQSL